MPQGYWTFEEVQAYLGHTRSESTEVWLSRHGVKSIRHYRVRDILAEREPKKFPRRRR